MRRSESLHIVQLRPNAGGKVVVNVKEESSILHYAAAFVVPT